MKLPPFPFRPLGAQHANLRSMPVSWGSNHSQNATSGYDIDQYCRFFSLHGHDLEFKRIAGLWSARVTEGDKVIAQSREHDTLFPALNDCYLTFRGFPLESIQPSIPDLGV
jgi:hypothetical protein